MDTSTSKAETIETPAKLLWKRRAKKVLVRVLVWYVVWLSLAMVLQRYLLFPSYYAEVMDDPGEGVEGLERIWIETEQGKVEGWFVPGKGVSAAAPGPVVFYAHGNAEVIDYFPYVLQPYTKLGVSVMLVEFRGYGRSEGSPSQRRITSDFVRFYDQIAARPDVDKSRIVFHGRSVGTGVVCALSRVCKPAAMILQSPFVSAKRMMRSYLVPPLLCLDPFDNAVAVRELDRPLLVLHGNRDEVIPFWHGRSLCDMVNGGRFSEFECGHNDFPDDSPRYWQEVESFLSGVGVTNRLPSRAPTSN